MTKLIKYLKPFTMSVIFIISLLFVQAMCDLSLPDYTSKIVNVGIQQNGIENAVPTAISKSELEKLTLLMSDEEKDKILENYTLLDKEKLSESEYDKYLKDYSKLEEEAIYKIDTKDQKTIDELNDIFGRSIFVSEGIKKQGLDGIKKAMAQNVDAANVKGKMPNAESSAMKGQTIPENADPILVISKMPKEQKNEIINKINEKIKDIPNSMITQSSVAFVKDQYKNIGIDTNNLQTNYILKTGGIMVLVALLSMAAAVFVGLFGAKVAAGLGKNLRQKVFSKVVNFSNSEFDKFSTASLITRSTNDVQQVQMLMVMLLRIVFYAPILGIGGVIKVINNDSSMAWIIVVAVGALLVIVGLLFGVAIPKFKKVQSLVDKLNLVTRESLIGMLVIRAFNTEKYEENRFHDANKNLTKTNLFVNRILALMMPLMMLIMNCITVLIVWVGAHRINDGLMQVGSMMAFIQYAMQIIMAFLMLTIVSVMIPRASVSGQRISEIIETDLVIKDPKKSEDFKEDKKGYVEFENVSFKYPGAIENVVEDINFTAKPGEITAFIGSTGSGKSTIVNLIPRLYDVTGGRVLVDGVDIRNVNQHDLREKIGYVPQKSVLFKGTIESNLKFGREDADIVVLGKASRISCADDFINSKEKGYDTEIAQGGNNVSGGQKQRLSIARALVKQSDIYIFDDSFSALDFKTDSKIRRLLKNEIKYATVMIVAQRISTIMHADKIIVLDEGKMVGMGTHKELIENCEVYKQIALSQLSKEELS